MTLDEFCEKWEVSEYGDGFLELSLKELNELLDETDDIEGNEKKAKELGDLALYHIERIEKRYGLDHANAWSRPKDCDMYITSSNGWCFSLGMINADKGVIFYITPSHNYVIYLKKGAN